MVFKVLRSLFVISVLFLLLSGVCGCTAQPQFERYEFTRLQMGVQTKITLYAANEQIAFEAAATAFEEIARLDSILSDYRSDSDLMQLCGSASNHPHPIPDELFDILRIAQDVSKATDGAFDVTVGQLSNLWRRSQQTGTLPPHDDVDRAMQSVGWQNIVLDEKKRSVTLLKPNMLLDLGGIAKGFAADRALQILRKRGMHRSMVALAGDIALGDPPPNQTGWRIAVGDSSHPPLLLHNTCISTSGDLEQFIETQGQRLSHIIDPRVGFRTVEPHLITAISPSGAVADAVASALRVDKSLQARVQRRFPDLQIIISADATHTPAAQPN